MPDNRGGVWWGSSPTTGASGGGLLQFGQSTAAPITVTPENAATYGFDKIGAQINPETGGIVNPFSGPADGLGGRTPRNNGNAVQRLPVAPGYSQIMANPAAVEFNNRLLNDPQFAQNNLRAGWDNPGAANPYGSGLTFTASGTPNTTTAPAGGSSAPKVDTVTGSFGDPSTPGTVGGDPNGVAPQGTFGESNLGTQTGTTQQPSVQPVLPAFMTQRAATPTMRVAGEEYGPNSQNAVTNAIFRRFNRDYWL